MSQSSTSAWTIVQFLLRKTQRVLCWNFFLINPGECEFSEKSINFLVMNLAFGKRSNYIHLFLYGKTCFFPMKQFFSNECSPTFLSYESTSYPFFREDRTFLRRFLSCHWARAKWTFLVGAHLRKLYPEAIHRGILREECKDLCSTREQWRSINHIECGRWARALRGCEK